MYSFTSFPSLSRFAGPCLAPFYIEPFFYGSYKRFMYGYNSYDEERKKGTTQAFEEEKKYYC